MHAVRDMLLTKEFIHAYVHGLVVKCYDGIERRIFPRFFTYGADYFEKVLLATIKYFGGCPCPQCFIEKDQIPEMGSKADMRRRQKLREDTSVWRDKIKLARSWIFGKGYLLAGAAVNRILKPQSWVPTTNAFSKLAEHGFNLFSMFVPDLLHEVELCVVKSLFIHTLRILQAHSADAIAKLDERFRQIPTFGRSTIRRFHANVSDMKKPAARNYEDILQCLLPVLEGLLPDAHNEILLDLWFILATWNSYAKLRMHTSSTIQNFSNVTTVLGRKVREFIRITCSYFTTYELPKETERARRDAQKNPATARPSNPSRKVKEWNVATYKFHSFGDYPTVIPKIGTTDSYSTQLSELTHRVVKKFYARTNKRKFGRQIANLEQRRRILRGTQQRMKDAATAAAAEAAANADSPPAESAAAETLRPQEEDLPRMPPPINHHISESKRNFFNVYDFHSLSKWADDPAVEGFLKKLRTHLLCRLLDLPYDGDETEFSPQDLMDVTFVRDRLYTHKVIGTHIIPAFAHGQTSDLLPKSIARRPEDKDQDYNYYYVNFFVDRDMFMRYFDKGVGHRVTAPCDPTDTENEDDEMDVDEDPVPAPLEENPLLCPDVPGSTNDAGAENSDEDDSELEEEEEEADEELTIGEDDEGIVDSAGYDDL
ncbi:GLOBIN domain-containing protein [Mycena venus]|uniref:GLOBIN domain-containing protein n=1 Tax=Mycena venus TaxID=2733690 RepID=A0A8H6YDH3_9AGAR|nr:GLOBIN domain-containing protein [Mycena venus]